LALSAGIYHAYVTRPWTMRRLVDKVVEMLGTAPARVDGGNLTFVLGDVNPTLWIWKDRYNKAIFGWAVITYDTALRAPMHSFGGMAIRIDHPAPSGEADLTNVPPPACYPWPTNGASLAAGFWAAVVNFGQPSLRFVRS
jgi:hypothetical protein